MNARLTRTIPAALALLCFAVTAPAAWIGLDGAVKTAPRVTTTEDGRGRVVVEIAVPGVETGIVAIDGRNYTKVALPGHVQLLDRGAPQLPYITTSLIIPGRGTPSVRVLKSDYREIATDAVVPSKGPITRDVDPATVPYVFGPAYAGGVFPARIAELSEPYVVRDHRGVNVRLFPVQWDVDRGVLRVLKSVTYEVVTEGTGGVNAKATAPDPAGPVFDALYAQKFANYDRAAKYAVNASDGPMLIVCSDAFVSAMEPFVAWKTQRGLDVELITTSSVGGSTSGVQDAITQRYGSPEGLAFVVLVGDGAQVPHYSGAYEGADDDTRYVRLDGTDVYPDALISRISAQTATDVSTQVAKFIGYERDVAGAADWTHKAVGVASSEGSPPDYERADLLRDDLLAFDFTDVDRVYEDQGGSTAGIAEAVGDGRSLVNYIGHGSGTGWGSVPFDNADVNGLTNTAWPWIIDVACLNGGISAISESFAEAWLRAGTPEAPFGAVGMYAASTSTAWVPPCVMQAEMVDLLCAETGNILGVLAHAGIMAMLDEYGTTGVGLQGVEQYNLFGDCSLQVRTDSPDVMTVAHQPTVARFAPMFAVDAGVPDVVCTLSGDGVVHGTGVTGVDGRVEIAMTHDLDTLGSVTLTAFGFNRETYQADVVVVLPANVSIVPASVPMGVATDVTVTVTEPDTGDAMDDVMIEIAGFGFDAGPVQTDAAGEVVISVTGAYGEDLAVRCREIDAAHDLFAGTLPVTGAAALDAPAVSADAPGVGLDGSLALDFEGEVVASMNDPDFTLHLQGGGLAVEQDVVGSTVTVLVTPSEPSDVTATLTRPGYQIFQQEIAVVEARGTLVGTVVDADVGNAPIAGARVYGFVQGDDPAGTPVFDVTTDIDGAYAVDGDLAAGFYDIHVAGFGYLPGVETYFVLHGANDHQIAVGPAPAGVLGGTVTAVEDGAPLDATVSVYRTDNDALFDEAVTDPATGAYTTGALPYFDYRVVVRGARRVPMSSVVTIAADSVAQHFVLEATQGDLLLLDDNDATARVLEDKLGKNGVVLASGYLAETERAVADLAADLTALGYTVTTEAADTSDPATWNLHDLVIVSCGSNTGPLGDDELRNALAGYSAGGGKLLVEGGEIAYDLRTNDLPFLTGVLHVAEWTGDNGGNVTVADATHHVMSVPNLIAGPLTLSYGGYGDADFVAVANDGQLVGSWDAHGASGSVVCYDSNPAPEGGQTVFLTFNYGALGAGRSDLLQNAVNWLLTPESGDATVSGAAHLYGDGDHAGITVTAIPGGGSVTTGAEGGFVLDGLFAGTYTVVASKDDWASDAVEVVVAAGETLSGLTLTLTPIVVSTDCDEPAAAIEDDQTVTATMDLAYDSTVTDIAVYVDITHTYIGDLTVKLVAPGGAEVVLHNRTGSNADDIVGWYPENLSPAGSLAGLVGESIAGTWSLSVTDNGGGDQGVVNEWCLRLSYGTSVPTPVEVDLPTVPALDGNYPNPFNPLTVIRFSVPSRRHVELAVYDVRGRKVRTLVQGVLPAGAHQVAWQGRDDVGRQVSSGLYFCRLTAGAESLVHKMLLMK